MIETLYTALLLAVGAADVNSVNNQMAAQSLETTRYQATSFWANANRNKLLTLVSDLDADSTKELPAVKEGQSVINGGLLPDTYGLVLTDRFKRLFGYCSYDHGTMKTSSGYYQGIDTPNDETVIGVVISSGADGLFQSDCKDLLSREAQNDDLAIYITQGQIP
ncbi:hypothetical protein MTBPR1_80154 [Candidatus Terasakiella magnetica]|uniref:Uncharacterized protein n=1 Tax=Candidatus Terasakiella magnetica TaxID=1867952 RepID=A0A1C3RLA6_9PROT|nr:hypothetical protein [Candidatus Terasakiella magnetica]SCA58100.1 hypothetical protein MTBPR1_80154 [Candidatus Terasakiella magnetica]